MERTMLIQTPRVIERTQQKEILKSMQLPKMKYMEKTLTQQKTIQRQAQKQIQKLTVKPVARLFLVPSTKPPRRITITGKPKTFYLPKLEKRKFKKSSSDVFSVYVRRRGKFSLLGAGLSLPKAFSLGTGKVRRTLAATFLVKQSKGIYRGKTPFGFYAKPTKLGTLYIEKRGQRLKKGTLEIPEIQYYRGLKGGRR